MAKQQNKISKSKIKLTRQTLILIAIVIAIIILIVVLAVNSHHQSKSSVQTTSPSTITSTTDREEIVGKGDEDEWSVYEQEDQQQQEQLNEKYRGRKDVRRDKHGNVIAGSGITKCILKDISPKTQYYYFNDDGVLDRKYKGLALDDNGTEYYVRNGKVDFSYSGLVSDGRYLNIIENGKWRNHYNGKIHMPDGNYDVHDGCVYGYALGRPYNFEWKPFFWYLDGEPDMYHKNG